MEDLEWLRKEIDKIDKELVKLFEKRMELSLKIANYKKKNGLLIIDKERENLVIEKNKESLENKKFQPELEDFFKCLMKISVEAQEKELN